MNERPAFREYIYSRQGNVVKTGDDRYFLISDAIGHPVSELDSTRNLRIVNALLLVGVYLLVHLLHLDLLISLAIYLSYALAVTLAAFLRYRLRRMTPLNADTLEEYNIPSWFVPQPGRQRVIKAILIISVALVCLLVLLGILGLIP